MLHAVSVASVHIVEPASERLVQSLYRFQWGVMAFLNTCL
jgi:hypothetical protein